jgi:hypothetical protein
LQVRLTLTSMELAIILRNIEIEGPIIRTIRTTDRDNQEVLKPRTVII